MNDDLLGYYNQELSFVRNLGREFAAAHPKIAGRLRLGAETVEDPHVSRLIESFALLNARTRLKLEDDFPEVSESLLGVLYPHYLAPLPSMSIVQMTLPRAQANLVAGLQVARGTTLETESIDGEPCRFRTSYDTTLWPIRVDAASLKSQPFTAPATPKASATVAVLQLSLSCVSPEVTFQQLGLDSLRFFLKGQSPYVYDLYELLHNNVLAVAVATSASDPKPSFLPRDCVQPVGFDRDELLLDYRARSFPGYALLSEYFAFPEKFLFAELTGLTPKVRSQLGNRLELFFYLNRVSRDLERNVTAESFQLGCTPIVNLFQQRAEPIRLTHAESSMHVMPDARRPQALEIYSIDRVIGTSPTDEQIEFRPFYSIARGSANEPRTFWHATRRAAGYVDGQLDTGTEMYLSLVDLSYRTMTEAGWTIDVETTCLNRNLPGRLPFGNGQPQLQLIGPAALAKVQCLTPPTATRRPPLRHSTRWRLVSHLSLNHLSLVDHENGAEPLREILRLYDFNDSPETRSMIDGILNVTSRRVVGRATGPAADGLCRGVEVNVCFDPQKFTGSGVFLFAQVLERFLGLYCTINSFTRLVATLHKREGELRRWPSRAGEKILV